MFRKLFCFLFLAISLTGCATVQLTDYIKSDRPYIRKINGKFSDIVNAVKVVVFKSGWEIQTQVNPSVYERRTDEQDQSQDLLLLSKIKQHPKFLYSTYTHMNIFIRAIADGAEVEIRYEALSPTGIKQFRGVRNDKLVNRLLDSIEAELESK